MSWQNAMREARLAVDRMQLKNEDIAGKVLDLNVLLADHPSRGRFRVMVMQAVDRLLVNRGATTNMGTVDIKRRRHPEEK